MATLPRTAKSSGDWAMNDLRAYNITVSSQSPEKFYNQRLLTVATLIRLGLDLNLLSGTLSTQGLSEKTYRLLQYLDLSSRAISDQESAVHDFARGILRAREYEERDFLLQTCYAIPLSINGTPNRSAQMDVCLVHGSSSAIVIPLVQTTVDPDPQIIASAIATFQYNNRIRAR